MMILNKGTLHRLLLQPLPLYLMLLPGLLYLVIYKYAPIYGIIIAFKDYNFVGGINGSDWANPWYKHFSTFYHSPYFWQVTVNTLLISLYKLIFSIAPQIFVAILFQECRSKRFRNVIQTLMYMPHFLSWVIIYGILVAFLSPNNGLLNQFIGDFGGDPISFLSSNDWFRSVLVGSDLWKDLGWGAIIYLAAMAGIDPSLYEAARVDGAGRWRMIWHITLPGIRSVIVLLTALKLGHILDAGFEQIYVMYNLQVYAVADIIDTWVFRTGLEQLNFSLAAAVGVFKSVIGLILVIAANQVAKRWDEAIW